MSLKFHDLLGMMVPRHNDDGFTQMCYDYVLVENLGIEYNDLELLDYERLEKIKRSSTQNLVNAFENELESFCKNMKKRSIPVDRIEARGKSGYILKGEVYQKILKEQIDANAKAFYENNSFGKGYNSVDIRTTVRDVIQNITPSDVLYGYVPLVLTFKPYFTANLGDRTKSVNSLDFLGINNIESYIYSATVNLDEFIKLLQEDGYILEFEDDRYSDSNRGPINNYNEYLNLIKLTPTNQNIGFKMNIDLRDNNNNMRR